jgi:hypothetical protein
MKLSIKEKCLITDLINIEIKNVYETAKEKSCLLNDIDAELDYIIDLKILKSKFKLNDIEKKKERELYN